METGTHQVDQYCLVWASMRGTSHANEDQAVCGQTHPWIAALDGVTRLSSYTGDTRVVDFVRELATKIKLELDRPSSLITPSRLIRVMHDANVLAGLLNQAQLRSNADEDFASVGAIATPDPSGESFHWAYLGDCGVARLAPCGKLTWISDDDLIQTRQALAKIEGGRSARIDYAQDYLRNAEITPLPDGAYGVLNGEPGFDRFVKYGTQTLAPGDMLVVFTDGGRPLLTQDDLRIHINRAARTGRPVELERVLLDHRPTEDDTTLACLYNASAPTQRIICDGGDAR